MTPFRPLEIRGKSLGDGKVPAICIPLVARDLDSLEAEAAAAVRAQPDVLEWRADYFLSGGGDFAEQQSRLAVAAKRLRANTGNIPLLFTLRSPDEGGEDSSLDAEQMASTTLQVAERGLFELIDVELSAGASHIAEVIAAAHASGSKVVVSTHDFNGTPAETEIFDRLARAAALGADVAKIAVMPKVADDVLRLLAATSRAQRELALPLITMAMGSLGVMTRIFGGFFGSALTFAAGLAASAPGQMPIAELRAAFEIVKSSSLPR